MKSNNPELKLKNTSFQEIHTDRGLLALDQRFLEALLKNNAALAEQLSCYREGKLSALETSEWLIQTAPILENFIAELFCIETAVQKLQDDVHASDALFANKKKNEKIFHPIQKKDYTNLVPMVPVENDPYARFEGPKETQRDRIGFQLTDERMSLPEVLDEIHYCVYCHKNEGDFCSKGFPVKKSNPEMGLKLNPVGDLLTGCPLEEKISEMHVVKKAGFNIGALAIITIDNPMCAVTGHRICNDCMKACIYQKQDPVNIPQVETRILTDVLSLPWGVEIYDLLIRWNPLRQEQFFPKTHNNKKVLIMGMGPAGFTLAHHLLMEGCAVVGMEGLKIEPLPKTLLENPVYDFDSLKESLDDRIMLGFGGVAEYGITVRWDKNFLKLIYLSLARRPFFQVFGSVRFGGTITVENAWKLGFDHIAIAVGAGLPRELRIPNSLAPGMRQANDFLMALQLTGAYKKTSVANLQMRLPAVVIGGGLTGIDTATEVQAYYLCQIEKAHQRYHILKNHFGETELRAQFDAESLRILDEFLQHADALIQEKQKEKPEINKLIRRWGGVTIVYRKSIQESPAYQRNHEEVIKALEEGIYYAQGLDPISVQLDQYGYCYALGCRSRIQDEFGVWQWSDEEKSLPAKSIFVATGAKPNIAYEFEHRGTFVREKDIYQSYGIHNTVIEKLGNVKEPFGIFTSYDKRDHRVSFLGDTHPVFHGSVVKAVASGKLGYPKIMQSLNGIRDQESGISNDYVSFRNTMATLFESKIISSIRHTDHIVELVIHSPMAAEQFQPGQFYRLQNYETGSEFQSEAVAALGVPHENKNQLSFFIVEKGASAKILTSMKAGDPIALMGPTGAKTPIPETKQSILIVGNEMAIIYLLSIGAAFKNAGHTVHFINTISEKNTFAMDRVTKIAETYCNTNHVIDTMLASPLNTIESFFVIGDAALLKTIQHARNGALKMHLHSNAKFTASVYGSMQCMLKGVCAQCLQWQIDPTTGQRTKAVYACSWQHQPMEIIDIDNLTDRLGQNKMQETLTNLWLDYVTNNIGSTHTRTQ